MASSILRLPAVVKMTGLSRSSIYLRISSGAFPRPVSLGARAVGWRESDINAWLEQLSQRIPESTRPKGSQSTELIS
jgi:prophage regulatory protein